MEIENIIGEACKYPFNDLNGFLKVAALFLLILVPILLAVFLTPGDINGAIVLLIFIVILGIIFGCLIAGYFVSVMKEGINQSGIIPSWDIKKNLVNGIKWAILGFIYSIIPIIIAFIIIFAFSGIMVLLNPYSPDYSGIGIAGAIAIIFLLVVFLIVTIIFNVGSLRFANTGSFSEGLNLSAVVDDLKEIGILKFVITFIMLCIVSGIIGLIGVFINMIPVIGIYIYLLVLLPISYLIQSYGFGLLYSEIA